MRVMEVVVGFVACAGAILLAKRGGKSMRSAIGWTARKSGWVASRVRASLHETAAVAREQYERGRVEAMTEAALARGNGPLPVANGAVGARASSEPSATTTTTV
jgi:hypothetical protein